MHRFVILITGLLILLEPYTARAAGMDIGMSTWYCWWDPSWNHEGAGYDIKPTFFYGPGLSFRLPANVSISTNFLYARVKAEAPLTMQSSEKKNYVIHRYDSDTTISYSFTGFFKLFAGFKYSNYQYVNDMTVVMLFNPFTAISGREKRRYDEFAPALGVGFTIHLIENFYLLITSSVLYNRCHVSSKAYVYTIDAVPRFYPYPDRRWSVDKIGANAQLSFAYLIQPINTSIAVGFRYQLFKIVKSNPGNDDYSEYYDHFYGVTASMLYRIEFAQKKNLTGESL